MKSLSQLCRLLEEIYLYYYSTDQQQCENNYGILDDSDSNDPVENENKQDVEEPTQPEYEKHDAEEPIQPEDEKHDVEEPIQPEDEKHDVEEPTQPEDEKDTDMTEPTQQETLPPPPQEEPAPDSVKRVLTDELEQPNEPDKEDNIDLSSINLNKLLEDIFYYIDAIRKALRIE